MSARRKILVAMSGGVDSSVAAALLQEQGHEIAGATIRTWASNQCSNLNTKACCGITGVEDAREVAQTLGIPYWVFDFENEFKKYVVDHFASEYKKGRTPNPCISCNEHIKFRLFLDRARQLGFDAIATGHYAQVDQDTSGRFYLSEGVDPGKDQAYVLFPLTQDVLQNLYLPVGRFAKSQIREKARDLGLCVMNKPDSQEICFIPSNDYGEFLEREYSLETTTKGKIITQDGKVLGEHPGYFHFTKGQRKGLGVAFSERLYVIETRPETNEVVVGFKDDVRDKKFRVGRMNWFLPPQEKTFRAHVKIRSQHQKTPALVHVLSDESVLLEVDLPQDAITPGQAAVIYRDRSVLGGGWIDEVMKEQAA